MSRGEEECPLKNRKEPAGFLVFDKGIRFSAFCFPP
jgi:hypothetical protein